MNEVTIEVPGSQVRPAHIRKYWDSKIPKTIEPRWLFWCANTALVAGILGTIALLLLGWFHVLTALAVLALASAGCATFVLAALQIFRHNKQAFDAVFSQALTYKINNDGIAVESEYGRGMTYWRAIKEVDETTDYFVLVLGPGRAIHLPKTCIENLDKIRTILNGKGAAA